MLKSVSLLYFVFHIYLSLSTSDRQKNTFSIQIWLWDDWHLSAMLNLLDYSLFWNNFLLSIILYAPASPSPFLDTSFQSLLLVSPSLFGLYCWTKLDLGSLLFSLHILSFGGLVYCHGLSDTYMLKIPKLISLAHVSLLSLSFFKYKHEMSFCLPHEHLKFNMCKFTFQFHSS